MKPIGNEERDHNHVFAFREVQPVGNERRLFHVNIQHFGISIHPANFFGLLFRRALIGAALVMFVCIAWSYHGLTSQPDNEIALVNYEVREDLLR